MKKTLFTFLFVSILFISANFVFAGSAHAVTYLRHRDASLFPKAKKDGLVFKALTIGNVNISAGPSKRQKTGIKYLAITGKYKGCLLYGKIAQWGGDKIWADVRKIVCPNKIIVRSAGKHMFNGIGYAISFYDKKPVIGLTATVTKTVGLLSNNWKWEYKKNPCPASYIPEFDREICAKWFVKNKTIANIFIDEKTMTVRKKTLNISYSPLGSTPSIKPSAVHTTIHLIPNRLTAINVHNYIKRVVVGNRSALSVNVIGDSVLIFPMVKKHLNTNMLIYTANGRLKVYNLFVSPGMTEIKN